MAAPPIRIRVGGEVDQSLARAFRTAVQLQGQAEKAMQRNKRQTTQAAEGEARKQLRAQEALTRAAEALDRQRSRALFGQFRAQEQAAERAAKAQERATARAHAAERRQIEQTARAAARAIEQERRQRAAAERAMTRRSVRQGESFARRTSHRTTRFLMPEAPIGSMAVRALGDVARGAGVDLSIAGGVGRSVALQTAAVQLANQERIATGKTRGAGAYETLARATADATSSDPGSALALASRFAARTGTYGDLDRITPQLASLARASGASFDEVGEAAGMVFQQFRGQSDAVEKTIETMRAIIGQSAEGAVDMPDYAKQLGRVAAGAFKFEGDRGRNIAALSALTQISMERGATSAADAARSTGSFVSTLGKGARLKEFEAAGVRVYNDDKIGADGKVVGGDKRTTLRPLEEIIKDSFRATNGNIPQLGRMYMDVLGRKGVESLGSEYQAAGGGEAGIQAIQKVFDRYMRATITAETERKNNEDVAKSDAGKAQRFQNALDKVTKSVMGEFGPALEKAGPLFLQFAAALGSLTTWVVENPKLAIAGAISASIARAGIESVLRSGIERMLLGPTNPVTGTGTRAAGIASVAGAAGGLLTVAAIGVTTLTVGMAVIDQLFWDAQRQQTEAVNADIGATNASSEAARLAAGGDLAGAKAKAEESLKLKQQALDQTVAQRPGYWDHVLRKGMGEDFGNNQFKEIDAQRERAIQQQSKELVASRNHLARIVELLESQSNGDGAGTSPGGRGTQ